MMEIQSGATSWWRNRHLLFVGMLLAFAGWFGYDGFIKYPEANRKQAAEIIGIPAADLPTSSLVRQASLEQIGKETTGTEDFDGVLALFKRNLGEPSYQKGQQYWWVGPAMYVKLDPNYVSPPDPTTGKSHRWAEVFYAPAGSSEGQIRGQKIWSLGILVLAGLVALKLVRVMTTRVVLDDVGLRYNRRSVSWEAMTGLRINDFERKYWVDLEYTGGDVTRSLRLDSLHIDKFNDIVRAICERKGFQSPLPGSGPKAEPEQDGPQ